MRFLHSNRPVVGLLHRCERVPARGTVPRISLLNLQKPLLARSLTYLCAMVCAPAKHLACCVFFELRANSIILGGADENEFASVSVPSLRELQRRCTRVAAACAPLLPESESTSLWIKCALPCVSGQHLHSLFQLLWSRCFCALGLFNSLDGQAGGGVGRAGRSCHLGIVSGCEFLALSLKQCALCMSLVCASSVPASRVILSGALVLSLAELPSRVPAACEAMSGSGASTDASYAVLLAAGFERLIRLSELDKRFAVLLKLLSNSDNLALHWVRLRQRQLDRWRSGWAQDVTRATLSEWAFQRSGDPLLRQALQDKACCFRAEAHIFLTESVVADHVRTANANGLPVPSGYVVRLFVKLLGALPQARPVSELCQRLGTNPNACKKWMSRFRDRWCFRWGDRCVPHGIGISVQDRRAIVFFRWFRWAVQCCHGGEIVVVNMDETMLNNVKPQAKGNLCGERGGHDVEQAIVRRPGVLPRTSLIAAICSDAAVQKVLPQVRLPKTIMGRIPSAAVLKAYAKAGAPQVARHGSAGWAGSPALCWWLRALLSAIKREKPRARVVLVWDRAATHISFDVLKVAKRLGIRIVVIPAKMTWCLQPLDTHVFSKLKHVIRSFEFARRAQAFSGTVSPLERVVLHGSAIRAVLVEAQWDVTMQRSGLTPAIGIVRDAVKDVYTRASSLPAMPSPDEFMDVLMVEASRVAELADLLFWAEPALPAPQAAAGAAAAVPAMPESQETAAATQMPSWTVLRLPTSARLGAAPSRVLGQNHWAPPQLLPRVVTRSMTSSRRSLTSAASAAASSQGPAKRLRQLKPSA